MDISQGLPLWIGGGLLLLSVACIARPQAWIALYAGIYRMGEAAAVLVGAFGIFFGALILTFHWQWSGWALVLTLMGALSLIEGAVLVFFPRILPLLLETLVEQENRQAAERTFRLMGIVKFLLALAILRGWQVQLPAL